MLKHVDSPPCCLTRAASMVVALACLWLACPATAGAQMVTGAYTGTGTDNRAITQIGFTPDVVIVKGANNQVGVFRTSTMAGDITKDSTGATALTANLIQSLDSAGGGGFTVGTDTQVNANGTVYYFAAFKAASGKVAVGSYSGTGVSQSITGVGFSPALVTVMDGGANYAVFRTTASTSSCDFSTVSCAATHITALGADGFTVGTTNQVNQSGHTYYYMAWASSEVTVGTYTGNNTDNRNISAGVAPEYVWVKSVATGAGTDGVQRMMSIDNSTDSTMQFIANAGGANRIQTLQATGFQIGTNARVNTNGRTYIYAAWVRSAPTAVKMSWATATKYADGTYLQWRTGYESDNLGFHVYRDVDGSRTRLTSGLIAGSGLLVRGTGNAGQKYQWWDTAAGDAKNVGYFIEDVDLNGTTTVHGPVRPVASGGPVPPGAPSRLLTQLLKKTDRADHKAERKIGAARAPDMKARTSLTPIVPLVETMPGAPVSTSASSTEVITPSGYVLTRKEYAAALSNQASLATGQSIKVAVKAEGWYRITQPQLVAAGYEATADSRTLQLFADGNEQPLKLVNETNSRLRASGAIEFYATGIDSPYTDEHVYWLRWGHALGTRAAWTDATPTGPPSIASFPFTVEHRNRETFFAALQNGEAENFFGEIVTTDPTELTLGAAHLDTTAATSATLEIVLQGVTDPANHFVGIRINSQDVGTVNFTGRGHVARSFAVPSSLLVAGDNVVTLVSNGGDSDVSLVDVVRLTYPRFYLADGDRLRLSAPGQQVVSVGGFSTGTVRVVDVTTPGVPIEVFGSVNAGGGGYEVVFTAPATGTRTLLAFAGANAWTPDRVASNQPSSWRKATNTASYVAVAPAAFMPAVQNLRAVREASGLSVAAVDIEDVYDEFSFGQKTPYALRDFLARAKAAWQVKPRFVTLVGNATTDPKNYLGMDEPDFVPTKIISTSSLETASDDWFVDGNSDGIPEVAAIGRIPARSLGQAHTMVEKIAAYERADGGWTHDLTLVADQKDAEDLDFVAASQSIESLIPSDYSVGQIFRGDVGTAAARADLLQRINDGQVIVNYVGHGSVQVWRDDLLTTDDVPVMTNGAKLPMFVMMNCLNGYFQGLFPEESLAEALVRAGNGGAIAVWASSGFTEPDGQAPMNRAFYKLLFEGQHRTIGEAAAAAKKFTSDRDVRRTWILFGDPAMRLAGMPAPAVTATAGPVRPQPDTTPAASGPPGGTQVRTTAVAHPDTLVHPRGFDVYAANFNNDDVTDYFLIDRVTGALVVAIANGQGTFAYTHPTLSTRWIVSVFDADDDGLDDLALLDSITGAYVEAISDGAGRFAIRASASGGVRSPI